MDGDCARRGKDAGGTGGPTQQSVGGTRLKDKQQCEVTTDATGGAPTGSVRLDVCSPVGEAHSPWEEDGDGGGGRGGDGGFGGDDGGGSDGGWEAEGEWWPEQRGFTYFRSPLGVLHDSLGDEEISDRDETRGTGRRDRRHKRKERTASLVGGSGGGARWAAREGVELGDFPGRGNVSGASGEDAGCWGGSSTAAHNPLDEEGGGRGWELGHVEEEGGGDGGDDDADVPFDLGFSDY